MCIKYREKPAIIEAVQWTGLNLEEIKSFVGKSLQYDIVDSAWKVGKGAPQVIITIKTFEGTHIYNCAKYDFVIKDADGEFYIYKPDIFAKIYDLVEE